MVSVSTKNSIVVIKIGTTSKKQAGELGNFLEEQAEVWLNRKSLQRELGDLDREESEAFEIN